MKRMFLGWHKPLLESAADFLIRHHTDRNGRLNLKNVTVVLPGSRACNRLEEILATQAAKSSSKAWYPPEFLTLESLPEKFYKKKKPIANELVRSFAWMAAINRLDAEDMALRKQLLPNLPANFDARLALGKTLDRLHYELASEGLDFDAVAKVCRKLKAVNEIPRWNALAALQKHYANDDPQGYLDEHDLWDIQAARLYAIEKQESREREEIRTKLREENRVFYLVGLVDMNKLQKEILKNFDSFITSLVFAPDDKTQHTERFDEFGCLRCEKWCNAPLEIGDDIIKIVLKPEHQADAVLREIAELGSDHSGGQIVVGVTDKEVVPFLQQRFAVAGLPSRLVEGTSIRRTGVYRFLAVLLKFLKTNHYLDYAELVRHPDIERYLRRQVDHPKHHNFVRLLDVYYNTFFPVFVPDAWKDIPGRHGESCEPLQKCREEIGRLLGISVRNSDEPEKSYSLGDWLTLLKTMFDKIYQGFHGDSQTDAALEIVFDMIDSLQSSLRGLPERFSFTEAIGVFLAQMESASIPPVGEAGAIEMIGWLEVAMDDAPVALITGMNDGKIPSFANTDMFLPDELRRELGLVDNRRRAARDAYYLNVLLETRKQSGRVALIAGRRSAEGNPLLPSRFFFVSDNVRKVSQRVRDFFKEMEPQIPVRLASSLQPGRTDAHAFAFPTLAPLERPIGRISVTSLGKYKECPYRFYLNSLLTLQKIEDGATELSASDFGTFVHAILQRFGENRTVRNSTSEKEIGDFLSTTLDEHLREHFGVTPLSTIEIQIERARERLLAFARWQAGWRQSGYEILDVELKHDDPASLAGVPLGGRIDRIDRKENELVVFDYKTGDTDPEKQHRDRQGWKDFQLPLYHYILRTSGYAGPGDTIRLGYVSVSKNVNGVRDRLVEWCDSEILEGIAEAERLIKEMVSLDWSSVRPVNPPPPYSDDYEFICHDNIS